MISDITIPPQCQQVDAQGQPVTCTQLPDGSWQVGTVDNSGSSGPGGLFAGAAGIIGVAFVVIIVLGIAGTVWRMRMARRIAEGAGLDPDAAATMSVLSPHGLEETYLAASLRGKAAPAAPPSGTPDVAARLRQLRDLKDQGLISDAEFTERRSAIINDV